MSNDGTGGGPKAVIPLAPKLNGKSAAGDELDRAGHAVLDAVRQAAGAAEAKHQQTIQANHNLYAQLRSAEERIKELKALVRHHGDRAERAEKWLYQISVEIEQKFFDAAPASTLRR